jgi:hypothetical protein
MSTTQPLSPGRESDSVSPLQDLISSLIHIQNSVHGLSVGGFDSLTEDGEVVEPEKGVEVSYRPDGTGAQVSLWISDRRLKVVTRSTGSADGWTEVTDRIVISLGDTSRLLNRHFATMDELASALVALMRHRAQSSALASRELRPAADTQRALTEGRSRRRVPTRPAGTAPARRSPYGPYDSVLNG